MLLFSEIFLFCSSLVLPLAAAIILSVFQEGCAKAAFLGALAQILALLVLRLPFFMMSGQWLSAVTSNIYLYAVLSCAINALSCAGLTWLIFRFVYGRQLDVKKAIAYAMGFGAMEGALYAGLQALNLIVQGSADPGISISSMWSIGIQRILMLVLETALIWLCAKSVIHSRPLLFWISLLCWFVLLLAGTLLSSIWMASAWITNILLAVISAGVIWKACRNGFFKNFKFVS